MAKGKLHRVPLGTANIVTRWFITGPDTTSDAKVP